MGEIAEMMLDGCMCQWCGEFLDEEAGFPVVCEGCQRAHGVDQYGEPLVEKKKKNRGVNATPKKFKCTQCGRGFRSDYSRSQHARDSHPVTQGGQK